MDHKKLVEIIKASRVAIGSFDPISEEFFDFSDEELGSFIETIFSKSLSEKEVLLILAGLTTGVDLTTVKRPSNDRQTESNG